MLCAEVLPLFRGFFQEGFPQQAHVFWRVWLHLASTVVQHHAFACLPLGHCSCCLGSHQRCALGARGQQQQAVESPVSIPPDLPRILKSQRPSIFTIYSHHVVDLSEFYALRTAWNSGDCGSGCSANACSSDDATNSSICSWCEEFVATCAMGSAPVACALSTAAI